jgi:tRNA-dihydrouridine synthase
MLGLAPMEGVSDFPFRRWLSLCSTAGFHSTPFLRVTETFPQSSIPEDFAPEVFDKNYREALNTPLLIQLMGPSPKRIITVGDMLLEHTDFFDINFGCPAPTVVGRGSGSALLQNASDFKTFVSSVHERLAGKFSVKIRTGYEDTDNYHDIISSLQDLNIRRLTIHGRTRSQKYMGLADWDLIEQAASCLSIPVFGSGDISSFDTYKKRKAIAPSTSGAIIGRACLKNPWIFESIKNPNGHSLDMIQILYALLTYGSFIEVFFQKGYEEFKRIDLATGIQSAPLQNPEDWNQYLSNYLKVAFDISRIEDVPLERRALSRIKMIWTYMKAAFPEDFHDRSLLRAKTTKEFIDIYLKKVREHNEMHKKAFVHL